MIFVKNIRNVNIQDYGDSHKFGGATAPTKGSRGFAPASWRPCAGETGRAKRVPVPKARVVSLYMKRDGVARRR